MEFVLYTSNTRGDVTTCYYGNKKEVDSAESMLEAVKFDHVAAEYNNNYRKVENFISSNVVFLDCDNDHSDDSKDWISPKDISINFNGVFFMAVYSRNHMKVKNGNIARPRFHVYFPIDEITSVAEYRAIKEKICSEFPYFDSNALDSARFIFGIQEPVVEVYEGNCKITEYLDSRDFENWDESQDTINEGSRNSVMSRRAGKIVKRYGNTDEAYKLFLENADKCKPPLDEVELSKIWKSAIKFGDKISKQKGYIPPEEYGLSYDDYKPKELTDIAVAEIFANHSKGKAVYTTSGGWLYWTGMKWEYSELKVMVLYMDVAKKILRNASYEFSQAHALMAQSEIDGCDLLIYKNKDRLKVAKSYLNFAKKINEHGKVSGILKISRSLLEISNTQLDSNPFLLNTPCGLVDLNNGSIQEHNSDFLCTKITTAVPVEDDKELWLKTLDDVTGGDKEFQLFLQYHAGSALIGRVYEESLLLVYGPGGNGKSTIFNSESYVLGDYAGKIPAEALTTRAKNVKVDLAEICGKRFILASETEEGQRLSGSTLKQIASVDEISAERKYYAPFSFKPSHSTILYTNHLPTVGTVDKGTWRRICIAPFNVDIKNPRTDYSEQLLKKSSGSILLWMIEGAKLFIKNNFKFPKCHTVEAATQIYKQENDWITNFINDSCIKIEGESEMSSVLYQAYRHWACENGEYIRNTRDFSKALLYKGFIKKRTAKGWFWFGICINHSAGINYDFLN